MVKNHLSKNALFWPRHTGQQFAVSMVCLVLSCWRVSLQKDLYHVELNDYKAVVNILLSSAAWMRPYRQQRDQY